MKKEESGCISCRLATDRDGQSLSPRFLIPLILSFYFYHDFIHLALSKSRIFCTIIETIFI